MVIDKMLTNEKYMGDALLQKTYTVDFLTKKKVMNRGCCCSIISKMTMKRLSRRNYSIGCRKKHAEPAFTGRLLRKKELRTKENTVPSMCCRISWSAPNAARPTRRQVW